MEDAWRSEDPESNFSIGFNLFADGPHAYTTPSESALVVLYSEIISTTEGLGIMCLEDEGVTEYVDYEGQPSHLWTARFWPNIQAVCPYVTELQNAVNITLSSPAPSGPFMNAIEIYSQLSYNDSITNPGDVAGIEDLMTIISLTEWQGDPCVPVPYNWLSCDVDASFNAQNVFSTTTGVSLISTYFNIISITLSNVSNTTFSANFGIPSPNGSLQGFNDMSITSSGVDYRAFLSLVNYTTIRSLISLNLSHNQFAGSISSLDDLVKMNSESLQNIDVSYNKLSGTFSSDVYFSLPELTFANFDNNSIQGILNLTEWHDSLQEAARTTSHTLSIPTATLPLLSFLNNNISDIVPSARDFNDTIQSLFRQSQTFGVLLNGNPYCRNIKSSVQQYLCRSSVQVPFKDYRKSRRTEIIVIGVLGGLFALILLCTSSATVWKLRQQLYVLRGIQQEVGGELVSALKESNTRPLTCEALADQKVKPPFYHYSDLKKASKDFHRTNKLGHGGFGVVYKAVFADETLAVKRLHNSKKFQVIDEFLNEVVLITGIKHRNLVQLKGCCIKDKQRILVYEYAEKGNLAEALWGLQAHGGLNWKQRLNICVGVARGLSYLHEELQPSIIHRDIKPQNILLDNNFSPKIADFGLARHISDETNQAHFTQIAGTFGYFAPEYAMHGQVSDKSDVYSYGILILEVISGRKCIDPTLPYEEKVLKNWVSLMRRQSLLFEILEPKLRQDCDVLEVIQAISIALLCVQHQPERRPTMSQVVMMFLGNMDIDISSDEVYKNPSNFNEFTISPDMEHPSLDVIREESPAFPLLDSLLSLGSHSAFASGSSGSSSSRQKSIELGIVSGQ